jgi:hypothetical protein
VASAAIRYQANNWIPYDFKKMRVIPTDYWSLSYPYGPGNHYPKSFCLEISDHGMNWGDIHRIADNSDLKRQCQFVRLRQTRKNRHGFDFLSLTGREIFGAPCHFANFF